jgi:hypothetical protein
MAFDENAPPGHEWISAEAFRDNEFSKLLKLS